MISANLIQQAGIDVVLSNSKKEDRDDCDDFRCMLRADYTVKLN